MEERKAFMKQFVKDTNVVNELLAYTENKFTATCQNFSREESPHIATYAKYANEAVSAGDFETLQKYLVQLQFPIQDGISKSEEYRNVTLRGRTKAGPFELKLQDPDSVKLVVYTSSIIGMVPVITVPNHQDFIKIVCALSYKNEPVELPASMGAAFIKGINNWERIRTIKNLWLRKNQGGNWAQEFKQNVMSCPEQYQDQLIIISAKPYSNIPSDVLGLDEYDWGSLSLKIRLEHECAHLFTLKYYGKVANNIHDEIIADYFGLISVLGQFNATWFLHFMGLEHYPVYRNGGRLQNYIQELSSEAFKVLQFIVKETVHHISRFDAILGRLQNDLDSVNRIKSICECDLVTLAMEGGTERLLEKYNSFAVSRQ